MNGEYLLRSVWSGEIWNTAESQRSPLADVLRILIPRPVVHLVTEEVLDAPFATYGATPLDGDATLADVLALELDVDVDDNDIVLIEQRSSAEDTLMSDAELGGLLGTMLVDLVTTNGLARGDVKLSGISTIDQAAVSRLNKYLPEVGTHLN